MSEFKLIKEIIKVKGQHNVFSKSSINFVFNSERVKVAKNVSQKNKILRGYI